MSKPLKQIYLDGAKYLRQHGWRQGDYGGRKWTGSDCPACIWGALMTASDSYSPEVELYSTLNNAFNSLSPDQYVLGPGSLVIWNDKTGRTKEEVIALLEKAAELSGAA